LQAAAIGRGGDIFVLNMGEPVSITYLAEQLIHLSGKRPGRDIKIVYTGLRPGEKLSEALFNDDENLLGTSGYDVGFVTSSGSVIYTPPATASILSGITRDSIITIAKDLKMDVRETNMQREMLYLADEIFFTGTAAEVTPVRSVDKVIIGTGMRGELTEALQERFFGLFDGSVEDRHSWLDYV
jgi:hypothetical protein